MAKFENLKPSQIKFSQNSVLNKFSESSTKISKKYIGVVLDELCDGEYTIEETILKNMAIGHYPRYGNTWFTVNNRSLWVLKELEALGKLNQPVKVRVVPKGIREDRFTTKNGGTCVDVRVSPVGGEKAVSAAFWQYKVFVGGYEEDIVEGYEEDNEGAKSEKEDDYDGYDSDEYYI